MNVTPHVYAVHIDDTAVSHPGGSNIFFCGSPSQGMVLVDTGEHDREWTRLILDAYKELGNPPISSIVITHSHSDHIGGLDRIYEVLQAPVRCHPILAGKLGSVVGNENVIKLKAGERIAVYGDVFLRAIFTPGHDDSHVCYYLSDDRVMFTGDTVLGSSSALVQDLSDYMKSLRKLLRYKVETICPGHGQVVTYPRGSHMIPWYINHRNEREDQVLGALRQGILNVDDMVKQIYPKNLKKGLRSAAGRNVQAHLQKLIRDGKVLVETSPAKYRLA